MPSLMGMSRAQFIENLDDSFDWLATPAAQTYSSVLPTWAQSGPWGWPMPYFSEMLFGAGKLGIVTNFLALGLGSFISFWAKAPESVNLGAVGATLLIGIDTIFGVAAASVFREFRSRLLRERLVSKFLYYGLFVLTAYVLGALLQVYWMIAGCWYAVTLIELASVTETLTRLHVKGGKRFGPAEKLLGLFAKAMGEAAKSALPNGPEEKNKDESK